MTYDECVERMVPHLEEAERMQEAYYWHMFGVLVSVTAQAFGLTVSEVETAVRRRAHRKRHYLRSRIRTESESGAIGLALGRGTF